MSGRSEQPDVVHHTDTEGDGRISTDKNWRRFRTALVAASILRKGNLQPIQRHDTESLSQDSWEWMYDVDAEECFIEYLDDNAAKSSDFGSDGYVASLTHWHEYLQITAPDPQCGLIFVRGDFPFTPDSVLARSQHRDYAGGKGTFGLQLLQDSDSGSKFHLGGCYARGLINYRWPHMQYWLKDDDFEDGFLETCSYVDDKEVHQIVRFKTGERKRGDSQDPDAQPNTTPKRIARFRIGGKIGFGCLCSSRKKQLSRYQFDTQLLDDDTLLTCKATSDDYDRLCEVRKVETCCLSMQFHVNGSRRAMVLKPAPAPKSIQQDARLLPEWIDISSEHDIEFEANKECVLILSFALTSGSSPKQFGSTPTSENVKEILGVTNTSENCTSRMWSACWNQEHGQVNMNEMYSIARCVEYVCSVTALPVLPWTKEAASLPSVTSTPKRLVPEIDNEYMVNVDETKFDVDTRKEGIPTNLQKVDRLSNESKRIADFLARQSEVPITNPIIPQLDPVLAASEPESTRTDTQSLQAPPIKHSNKDSNDNEGSLLSNSSAYSPEILPFSPRSIPLQPSTKSISSSIKAPPDQLKDHVADINGAPGNSGLQDLAPIAFLQNIMFVQSVNLESLFWQVRLLVKVENFLYQRFERRGSTEGVSKDPNNDDEEDKEIMVVYRKFKSRLKNVIKGVLIWIATLRTSKGLANRVKRRSDEEDPYRNVRPIMNPEDQLFNVEIHKYWWNYNTVKFDEDVHRVEQIDRAEISHWNPGWEAACFISITVFYILNNCTAITKEVRSYAWVWKNLPELIQEKLPREMEVKTALLQWYHSCCLYSIPELLYGEFKSDTKEAQLSHINQLGRIALKLTRPSNKPKSDPYKFEEEQIDRLILLSSEGILKCASTKPNSVYVAEKINHRVNTTTVNPGFSDSKPASSTEAPWELDCLNHHIALKIAVDDLEYGDIKSNKEACFDFFSADMMFIPTWDRSRRSMTEQWWNIDISCIVCTTLLELRTSGSDKQKSTDLQGQVNSTTVASGLGNSTTPVDWRRSITKTAFGDEWVQSLDDTPNKFLSSQTKDIDLRYGLRPYLDSFRDYKGDSYAIPPSYSGQEIHRIIPVGDLLYLSVYDMGLPTDFGEPIYCWGRFQLKNFQQDFQFPDLPESVKNDLWAWIIDGHPWESFSFPPSLSEDVIKKMKEPDLRKHVFQSHQANGLERLSDSMVDLGVKYRIMLAQRCSPSVVQAFVYMWHPGAIDAFDSYFGSRSSFTDLREREEDSWTTSITLIHWALEPQKYKLDPQTKAVLDSRYAEPRQRGNFPPSKALPRSHRKSPSNSGGSHGVIEERSSVLVITGDSRGDLWTCSVWSSLISEFDPQNPPLNKIRDVLRLFKHQPSTGRSLVFLFILGLMCEKISAELDDRIKGMEEYVELGQQVFLEGYDWEADNAVEKLQSMVWGLEALKTFDGRLSACLDSIEHARKALEDQMENEPGKRHDELTREYRRTLEHFSKPYDLLSGNRARLKLKIEQVTGLLDGLSTITNVQDSHTAVKQGNNIRILTYITIAYLPLGFITALFSMNHNIVADSAGSTLFAILITVFVIGTYSLAFSLEAVIEIFENNFGARKTRRSKKRLWLKENFRPTRFYEWSNNHFKKPKPMVTQEQTTTQHSDNGKSIFKSNTKPRKEAWFPSLFRRRMRYASSGDDSLDSAEKAILTNGHAIAEELKASPA